MNAVFARLNLLFYFLFLGIQTFIPSVCGMEEISTVQVSDKLLLQTMHVPTLEERDDPPIFCIDHPKRKIYVIGSFHTLPLRFCFTQPVLEELNRISTLRPILYTEHESSNAQALQLLEDPRNKLDPVFLEANINLFSSLGLDEEEIREFQECCREKNFLMNKAGISKTPIEESFKAELWLAAPLLGAQANLLSTVKFGGLESDLTEQSPWKERWQAQRYLESTSQALGFLKESERKDYDKNRDWVKSSVRAITNLTNTEDSLLEKKYAFTFKKMLKTYSWRVIVEHDPRDLPESAISRNKLWADVIFENCQTEQTNCPYVILVGTGHLAGAQKKCSFISFLNAKLNAPLLRVDNKGQWQLVK